MTLFVGDSVARTTNLRLPSYVGVEGVGSRGELLLATRWGPSDFEEAWLPGHMVRFDLETGILDTVASYDFMPCIPPGLEWDPIRAVGEVTVATGHFVHVRSDRAEVTWRLSDGTVTQIVRWQAESVQLTEELLEPVDAKHLKSLRLHSPNLSDAQIAELADEHMAVYHASVGRPLPLFGAAFADAEGRVWLPSYNAGGEFTAVPPYTVIAADGAWLGNVEAPPRFVAHPGHIVRAPLLERRHQRLAGISRVEAHGGVAAQMPLRPLLKWKGGTDDPVRFAPAPPSPCRPSCSLAGRG